MQEHNQRGHPISKHGVCLIKVLTRIPHALSSKKAVKVEMKGEERCQDQAVWGDAPKLHTRLM
jgi:hypothetical protein